MSRGLILLPLRLFTLQESQRDFVSTDNNVPFIARGRRCQGTSQDEIKASIYCVLTDRVVNIPADLL